MYFFNCKRGSTYRVVRFKCFGCFSRKRFKISKSKKHLLVPGFTEENSGNVLYLKSRYYDVM